MTIIDSAGKPKYEIGPDNVIVDMEHCVCLEPAFVAAWSKLCTKCNKERKD